MNKIIIKKKYIKYNNINKLTFIYIKKKKNKNNKIILIIKKFYNTKKYLKNIILKLINNNFNIIIPNLLKNIKNNPNLIKDKYIIYNINKIILWLKKKKKKSKIIIIGIYNLSRLSWLYSYIYFKYIYCTISIDNKLIYKINNKHQISPIDIILDIKIPFLCIYNKKKGDKNLKKIKKKINKNKKINFIIYKNKLNKKKYNNNFFLKSIKNIILNFLYKWIK